MITDNEIYAISGRDLKQFVHLVSDLKEVAIDYTNRVEELDIKETELSFDNFDEMPVHKKFLNIIDILSIHIHLDKKTKDELIHLM